MESLLPIYYTLKDEVQSNPVNPDWKTIVSKIHQLSTEHLENIYIMIYHHTCLEGNKKILPYSSKYLSDQKKGVIFQIQHLPMLLQYIIAKYVEHVTNETQAAV